jgi:hypothetical protein
MSIRPEAPGEIYEDSKGRRWLVMSLCNEPTVTMQQVLPQWHENTMMPFTQSGGITGLMWNGFKKVLDAPAETP